MTSIPTQYYGYIHMTPHNSHSTLITFNIDAINLNPNWILANASDCFMIMTLTYHSIYY